MRRLRSAGEEFATLIAHHHPLNRVRRLLVFGDAAFEEAGLLFDVHHFGEPGEGIGGVGLERGQAARDQTTISNVVDVGFKISRVEADAGDGKTVADELFFEANALGHGCAEILFELIGPDVWVFRDEVHQQVAKEFDVVGFIAQGVAEHGADPRELVLAVKAQDHLTPF